MTATGFFDWVPWSFTKKWDELEQYVVERIGFPKDIWEKTVAIGARLEELSHNLLEDATKQFEETKTQIGELKETVGEIVGATADLRVGIQDIASAMGQTVLESSNDPSGVYLRGVEKSNDEARLMNNALSLEHISAEVAQLHQRIIDEMEKDLPPPDHAPSHANREMMVDSILQRAESGFIDLIRTQGLAEEELDNLCETFGRIARPVKKLTVLVGDLAEQHPILLETLLFTAAGLIIPEYWLLRPLLSVFGFGPLGPAKGSAAAWAQQRFWGAAVNRGSWFAWLQRAGMTRMTLSELVKGLSKAALSK